MNLTELKRRRHQIQRKLTAFQPSRKAVAIGGSVSLLIVIGIIFAFSQQSDTTRASVREQDLDFAAVSPAGESFASLGGLKPSYPDGNAPVYVFGDTIEDVPVNVSQQALPDTIKSDPATGVAEIAKNFNATNTLAAKDLTAYIGTSAKGPQSVIFVKGDTLVLIKSDNKISGPAWVAYIDSLR